MRVIRGKIGHRGVRMGAVFLFTSAIAFSYFLFCGIAEPAHGQSRRSRAQRAVRNAPSRYSSFPHNVAAHRKECNSCHTFPSDNWKNVRAAADAFPDVTEYPKHESCLSCHRQQFFKGTPPAICSICHVNPGPRDSRRHAFPNPRERFDATPKGEKAVSDFEIRFPHSTHIEIVSSNREARGLFRNASFRPKTAEESCAVCHKTLQPQGDSADEYATKPPTNLGEAFWLKKGTFKSVPTGHTTCFTCHSVDSGVNPAPSSCATCHSLKQKTPPADFDAALSARMKISEKVVLDAWRRRDSSGKFRHEWMSHAELSCSTCHNVEQMNTLDPATKRVPVASCSTCHATATADDGGALTVEADARRKNPRFECTKCHVVFGRQPIPASHVAALKEAGAAQ